MFEDLEGFGAFYFAEGVCGGVGLEGVGGLELQVGYAVFEAVVLA